MFNRENLADSYSPTSYMPTYQPTYQPTYAPSAAEKAVVTVPWSWEEGGCPELTERMSLLPCSRMQGDYVQNNTLRICSSACDAVFDKCGLPGENLASSYNYTDGRSLCYNVWGGADGSSSCDYDAYGALCQSGIVNIEVVDGDDCLGADSQYPHCDGDSDYSSENWTSKSSSWPTSWTRYFYWIAVVIGLPLYWFLKYRRIKRRREGEQGATDAAADTLPTASATPMGTGPVPATQSIPVAAAVPEPPVTPVVQATAVAANGTESTKNEHVTAGKQLTFDQEMDIQSLEFKLRMEMITQEQFDDAKREILNK